MNAIAHIDAGLQQVPMTIETWVSVRDLLLPSLARLHGTHTETDIVAMLLAGQAGLWVGGGSAMITEVRVYPRLKELSIMAAGGVKQVLVDAQPALECHAHEHGCKRIRNEGRWGWRKWEGEHTGFRFLSTTIVKDL